MNTTNLTLLKENHFSFVEQSSSSLLCGMKGAVCLFLILILNQGSAVEIRSNPKITVEEYINTWNEIAIRHMAEFGIPASITLAQGILESGFGNSKLARKANNHFGIKCHNWKGKTFRKHDDRPNECFRHYDNAVESFNDHADFLKGKSRYAFLFDLRPTDYKSWAKGLKKAGYATNPKYPKLLIGIIEKYDLSKFDHKNPESKLASASHSRKPGNRHLTDQVRPETHNIWKHVNNIKCVTVAAGDTYYKISKETGVKLFRLYKYNDTKFSKEQYLKPGQTIFLQPKRSKAKQEVHVVVDGETLYSISQKHGIKLKKLCRKNGLQPESQISVGQKLHLRRKKK